MTISYLLLCSRLLPPFESWLLFSWEGMRRKRLRGVRGCADAFNSQLSTKKLLTTNYSLLTTLYYKVVDIRLESMRSGRESNERSRRHY